MLLLQLTAFGDLGNRAPALLLVEMQQKYKRGQLQGILLIAEGRAVGQVKEK